ncbi:glycosyltransferase family 2 protein [Paraburkholderia silvatlantica]|uniref:GT2 family glycosyltransferase n=1 Tax=Paraburkholderia silvatlantica TaxID=321895 RepID=A0ABR6G0A6_9BURK|nr:glycosyltransferase [Paraburkholderia silvatlantica]MBB2932430.1 GT2 family glycosyltransferase [Paraburkholderia silvatlantica]PVY21607.1 GT2 family glycosyltransferase [Paraburkholderia silvatlantica]PXW26916.1 GT2 family glycosyltransferase [Paraburkholderia silvatlantica]
MSQSSLNRNPKICLIFATRGRAEILEHVVAFVDRQTVRPDLIIVSCVSDEDVGDLAAGPGLIVLKGKPGLTAQRNHALNHVPEDVDVVIFLDDDFLMHGAWISEVLKAFDSDPSIACVTGTVIADGIHGPGYSFEEGRAIVARAGYLPARMIVAPTGGPYGCNMAFRASSIAGLRFDERLVLYGWQEDRDFGGQIWNRGSLVVRINTALGVHLGVKRGRVSGCKLGYSQVINPLYLVKKRTMPLRPALDHVMRNVVSNMVRSVAPEPWIDRRGRLIGNLIGLWDFMRGRLTPERPETF